MDNYMPVYKETRKFTEPEQLLRRINTLKDKVLPVKHRLYMNARKQLKFCMTKRKECLADWKVLRTTVSVYITASEELKSFEAELRKCKIMLKAYKRGR